jgi:calcium/calmodulin-dependent protein kinase I
MQIQLSGTAAVVFKTGVLLVRSRFTGKRRPRKVVLDGARLCLREVDEGDGAASVSPARTYDVDNARLQATKSSLEFTLQLATKEKLTVFAQSEGEFDAWHAALSNSVQWKIERFYEIGIEIGEGAFSHVMRGIHKGTSEQVAVKVIEKHTCSSSELTYLQREIDIMRMLKHENVTQTRDCFESETHLYIVQEYMAGGSLNGVIKRFGLISETNSRIIMQHVFRGLQYIHGIGVVHRDIKPENLMCTTLQLPTIVTLADFGLSRRTKDFKGCEREDDDDALGPDGLMTTPVGTACYAAPEVLQGLPYGKEVDMFSCGVVMYLLLSGKLPFSNANPQKLVEIIKRADFSFPDAEWRLISKEAKHLVKCLLDRSPFTRVSAEAALQHPWIIGPKIFSSISSKYMEETSIAERFASGDASSSERFGSLVSSHVSRSAPDKRGVC